VRAQRKDKNKVRISWNAAVDCDGNTVAGYNIYRAATAAGPFSKINTGLVTDTVYDDTEGGLGVASGGAGAGSYYMVSAVDSAGTESVNSLAVRPASALASGGAGVLGCFISTAQNTAVPKAMGWVVLFLVALFVWRTVQGSPAGCGISYLDFIYINVLKRRKVSDMKDKGSKVQ
jgi:hypothetical protein